eukprot:g4659.t1
MVRKPSTRRNSVSAAHQNVSEDSSKSHPAPTVRRKSTRIRKPTSFPDFCSDQKTLNSATTPKKKSKASKARKHGGKSGNPRRRSRSCIGVNNSENNASKRNVVDEDSSEILGDSDSESGGELDKAQKQKLLAKHLKKKLALELKHMQACSREEIQKKKAEREAQNEAKKLLNEEKRMELAQRKQKLKQEKERHEMEMKKMKAEVETQKINEAIRKKKEFASIALEKA